MSAGKAIKTVDCYLFYLNTENILTFYFARLIFCLTFASLLKSFGRLAQLVQSICLTSRGSAVRIRQRPRNKEKRVSFIFPHNRAFSSAGSEHLPYKQRVGGSNPSTPTRQRKEILLFFISPIIGRLAQLVQSICLTSRGSAVRIRQRPQHCFTSIAVVVKFFLSKKIIQINFLNKTMASLQLTSVSSDEVLPPHVINPTQCRFIPVHQYPKKKLYPTCDLEQSDHGKGNMLFIHGKTIIQIYKTDIMP